MKRNSFISSGSLMMFNKTPMLTLLGVSALLSACSNYQPTPYYEKDGLVTIDGIDVSVEQGNVGGQIVNISGSGFGAEPSQVSVVFGNFTPESLMILEIF